MKYVLLIMVLLSSFLVFLAIFQWLFLQNRKLNKRMKHYLELSDKKKLHPKQFNLMVQMQLYRQTVKEKVLTKQKNEKISELLARAGLPMRPEEYLLFQWISSGLCAFLMFFLFESWLFLPVGAGLGFLLPGWWVRRKEKERMHKFNEGLEDMITTVIGSLRAGFSFPQALKTVAEEAADPMKTEMEMLLREMQYGTSMEEALLRLKERMPSEDLNLMIQAILIQRQVGGNLAVVLETIVRTIRDRSRIQRQVKTLTAQGRMSGMVISILPVAITFFLYIVEPEYIGTLFTNQIGMMMVAGAVISGLIGIVLIRKMTKIEV